MHVDVKTRLIVRIDRKRDVTSVYSSHVFSVGDSFVDNKNVPDVIFNTSVVLYLIDEKRSLGRLLRANVYMILSENCMSNFI